MDRKEREERLKRLGKIPNSFSILPLINVVIASLATLGLFFIFKNQDDKNITTKSQDQKEQYSNNSNQEKQKQDKDSNNQLKNNSDNKIPNKNVSNDSVKTPNLSEDLKNQTPLQIENKIINLAKQRNLPVDKLSISFINFSKLTCELSRENNRICYDKYQDKIPRYPASLVKLFWLVIAYGKYPNPNAQFFEQLREMIVNSDNEDSSRVVDKITQTKSTKQKLSNNDFITFQEKRNSLNKIFKDTRYQNYQNINISQKTFPIPYLEMEMPEGADLQLRHPNNEEKPIRNYLTSKSVATLLYQIYNRQFPQSEEMLSLLKRDLNPSVWQDIPFNSIKGFLGEGLTDKNVNFYSKMGWTFSNRNDAAIVVSPDGKISYILVILGDDPAYYKDVEFLPLVSRMVYEEMSKLSSP